MIFLLALAPWSACWGGARRGRSPAPRRHCEPGSCYGRAKAGLLSLFHAGSRPFASFVRDELGLAESDDRVRDIVEGAGLFEKRLVGSDDRIELTPKGQTIAERLARAPDIVYDPELLQALGYLDHDALLHRKVGDEVDIELAVVKAVGDGKLTSNPVPLDLLQPILAQSKLIAPLDDSSSLTLTDPGAKLYRVLRKETPVGRHRDAYVDQLALFKAFRGLRQRELFELAATAGLDIKRALKFFEGMRQFVQIDGQSVRLTQRGIAAYALARAASFEKPDPKLLKLLGYTIPEDPSVGTRLRRPRQWTELALDLIGILGWQGMTTVTSLRDKLGISGYVAKELAQENPYLEWYENAYGRFIRLTDEGRAFYREMTGREAAVTTAWMRAF